MEHNGYRVRRSKKELGNEFTGVISPQPDRKIPTASGDSWPNTPPPPKPTVTPLRGKKVHK